MNNWLKIALLSALPMLGHAHTMSPYLIPDVFDASSNNISFQSGVTVEKFYVPTVNFKTSYVVTDPTGKQTPVEAAGQLKRFSVGEFDLSVDGTYRIRTQDATGNPTKYAQVDGRWLRVRPARPANAAAMPAKPMTAQPAKAAAAPAQPPRAITADQVPANAPTLEVANHFIAETFVSKNKPSAIAAPTNKGFELKFISHPNELFAGESFKAQLLLDGKALPNVEVDVFKGASSYQAGANREQPSVNSNKKGEFEINFTEAGIYLIAISYPEANPDNTQKPAAANYTYSLSVEVSE